MQNEAQRHGRESQDTTLVHTAPAVIHPPRPTDSERLAHATRARHRNAGRLGGRHRTAMALVLVTALGAGCAATTSASSNEPPPSTAPTVNSLGGIIAGPPDTAAVSGGKIVYGIDAEPEGLDPSRFAFSQAGHAVASAVFEPLATLDDQGNAVPYLATAFDHTADNKTWTITLPTDVTFHDGTPMNADAVVSVLKAYQVSAIDGAALVAVDTFTASDPTHVVVALKRPLAAFPALLTTQAGYVIAPAMLANQDLAKKPIGTGPFVFDNHVDGKLWSLKKNPTYRRKGLPHLASIDFVPVPDPVERNNRLRTNDLDVIQTNTGPQVVDLRATSDKLVENRYGDKGFLTLNTSKPPFDSVTARRAVAFATDAARWRREVQADIATPANSPFGPGQPGYLADNGFPTFNMDEAKKLVKQYEAEKGVPLEFTFLVVDDPSNMAVGQTMVTNLEAAGMKVTIDAKPQITLLASVAFGGYQLSQFRVFAQPNPDADVHFYRTSSITPVISLNFPRYANPDVDSAVDEATASTDPAVRARAYEKVNRIFADQVPFVWLGQEVWMVAANPRVNGIYAAANGSIATVGAKTWIADLSVNQ